MGWGPRWGGLWLRTARYTDKQRVWHLLPLVLTVAACVPGVDRSKSWLKLRSEIPQNLTLTKNTWSTKTHTLWLSWSETPHSVILELHMVGERQPGSKCSTLLWKLTLHTTVSSTVLVSNKASIFICLKNKTKQDLNISLTTRSLTSLCVQINVQPLPQILAKQTRRVGIKISHDPVAYIPVHTSTIPVIPDQTVRSFVQLTLICS